MEFKKNDVDSLIDFCHGTEYRVNTTFLNTKINSCYLSQNQQYC